MSAKLGTAAEPVLIKRYPNRRLYDTRESRYVTLSDLVEMVMSGTHFKVVSSKSGEDVTRMVLMQIIAEREERGPALMPASFMTSLIHFYGDAMQTMVSAYLEACMQAFVINQKNLRHSLWSAFSGGLPFGPAGLMPGPDAETPEPAEDRPAEDTPAKDG